MPQTNEPHLDVQVGNRHHDGRPFHFSTLSQDDRIRKVFGLSEDAPIPPVRAETLAVYFDHLSAQLSLPFEAMYCQNSGKVRHLIHYVQVTELLDPRHSRNRTIYGLFGKARYDGKEMELPLTELGVMEDHPNCQTIDDYAYWFVNWR
jgi:hypothetical protein